MHLAGNYNLGLNYSNYQAGKQRLQKQNFSKSLNSLKSDSVSFGLDNKSKFWAKLFKIINDYINKGKFEFVNNGMSKANVIKKLNSTLGSKDVETIETIKTQIAKLLKPNEKYPEAIEQFCDDLRKKGNGYPAYINEQIKKAKLELAQIDEKENTVINKIKDYKAQLEEIKTITKDSLFKDAMDKTNLLAGVSAVKVGDENGLRIDNFKFFATILQVMRTKQQIEQKISTLPKIIKQCEYDLSLLKQDRNYYETRVNMFETIRSQLYIKEE